MIRNITFNERDLITEDPVRPHIPFEKRIGGGRSIVVLENNDCIDAVVCFALCKDVPITEQEMFELSDPEGDVCVAYTVWSYNKGAGRTIINQLRDNAQDLYARMVTLSPLTEMAERFHISNGATFLRKGESCQNFEYPL
jgi:hypothetical protein